MDPEELTPEAEDAFLSLVTEDDDESGEPTPSEGLHESSDPEGASRDERGRFKARAAQDDDGEPAGDGDDPDGEGAEGEQRAEGDESSEGDEPSEEGISTLKDLAAAFDVEESDLAATIEIETADGSRHSLADVIQSFQEGPVLTQGRAQLDAQRAEFEQEREASKAQIESQMRALTAHTERMVADLESEAAGLEKLREEDPAEWAARNQEHLQKRQQVLQAIEDLKAAEQHHDAERQRADAVNAQRELEALASKIPEARDPAGALVLQKNLTAYFMREGYTEDEVNSVTGHRFLITAMKAAKYDELTRKGSAAGKKVLTLPKHVKAQGRRESQGGERRRDRVARERHAKVGTVDTAAAAIEGTL